MEIIGSGFLARHLHPHRGRHPDVTVLAAGVPRHHVPDVAHRREADLVRETVRSCLRTDRRLVFLSTISMYGSPGCTGREDLPVEPSNRYGAHKLRLEQLVRRSGVRHLVVRSAYVVGPHGPRFRLLPALIEQLRAGRVVLERNACRDMVHVNDFVAVLDELLTGDVADQVVNVASGDCVAVADIVDHLEMRLALTSNRVIVNGAGIPFRASTARLRALVPGIARLGFGPGYHRTVIDRYLAEVAAAA